MSRKFIVTLTNLLNPLMDENPIPLHKSIHKFRTQLTWQVRVKTNAKIRQHVSMRLKMMIEDRIEKYEDRGDI